MEQSKLDGYLSRLIDQVGSRNQRKGFILDLAGNARDVVRNAQDNVSKLITELEAGSGTLTDPQCHDTLAELRRLDNALAETHIEIREGLEPIDEYEAPADVPGHLVRDEAALAAYMLRYGDPKRGLVLFSTEGVYGVLDEQQDRGVRAGCTLKLTPSKENQMWCGLLDRPMGHIELLQSLLQVEHTLNDAGLQLISELRHLKVSSTIDYEAGIQLDGATLGVTFTSAGGGKLEKLTRQFKATLPLLAADVAREERWQRCEVKLEVTPPRNSAETSSGGRFVLRAPTWHQLDQYRADLMLADLEELLGDAWLLVHGTPNYQPRPIGRNADRGY